MINTSVAIVQFNKKEFLFLFLFYLGFSWLYNVVLWYNGMLFIEEPWSFLSLKGYWFRAGMQYVFYLAASILIYLVILKPLKKKKWSVQILAVVFVTPLVIYFVREIRYELIDYLGRGRLSGTGEIWDWYIPLLFLYIQFGIYFAYKYFLENQQKLRIEGELRQAALKSELSAIKAQLNPHFLYNIFNSINASLPPENERTRDMVARLSDLFRYQLKASRQELVPLGEEISFVKKYLQLEKERFEERLLVHINVPENLLNEMVPPMILQPLVENSIKHGLSSLVDGGEISIKVFKKLEKLNFEIADTGIGAKEKDKLFDKGVGLANTQLRLQKMYNSVLIIEDNSPSGLKINFSI